MNTPDLKLDARSIAPDQLSIPTLMREIGLSHRPNWLLRLLMNALENKRQAKGMGWSRPWNKYGLNIFRTHNTHLHEDTDHYAPIAPFLDQFAPRIPPDYADFVAELLADPSCMTFVFYHNHDDDTGQYEGLTLSFGRRNAEDKTKRDRFDIILEDRRTDGRVDGEVERLRVYVCPWNRFRNNREHFHLESSDFTDAERAAVRGLYQEAVRHYHQWKSVEERQWSHWSQQYIDYFGSRNFIPVGTSFS